eukprot:CAMPEP_0194437044 /NCGR_PEP_ID=MMETSP0176-20130528/97888_1 /TAXON_ID=216777 /ORGANISM="Proboscia alata, Strain PI-D3" /LENGTH=70 /DNA_ID=CAMNT_0039257959 /DNA_START=65 /DNA_END=274 /DNA_ORIENTATION=-
MTGSPQQHYRSNMNKRKQIRYGRKNQNDDEYNNNDDGATRRMRYAESLQKLGMAAIGSKDSSRYGKGKPL